MKPKGVLVLALLLAAAAPALATDGYFQLGYGTPYVAMGGAGVALSLSTIGPATNPASNAFRTGWDVDVAAFMPSREFTVTGAPSGYPGTFGLLPGNVKSGNSFFVMPAIGANWKLGGAWTLGVALYGNGGMNTAYSEPVFYAGRTGVNLAQMFVAPTVTYRIAEGHALGVTGILSFQRFQAEGLLSFAPFSSNPSALSNRGYDEAFGVGLRIGYLGKLTPWLAVGGAYQTETEMAKFKNYSGLFAEQGDFDIPANWTAGLALTPCDRCTLAVDVQQIFFSRTESIGNPMLPNLMMAPLGADGGAGFGWKDVTTLKIGAAYEVSETLTLRAGYAHCTQPIPASEVLFNILAPGVIQDHFTVGASQKVSKKATLQLGVVYAPAYSVIGPNPLEVPGKQTIELKMSQWLVSVGASFGF
ncbi:MAG TPA: outer membrane protein transport protein [Thermoanaerobaculia bacterium]|nr:outer membrane protein transport protein [Thermoanaerobaculia bacterium]HQR66424.1 outer membrane protein transport protein [Thermoanaerobaculia bacterium]